MDQVQVTLDPDDYQQFGECLDIGGWTLSKTADLKRFDLQLNSLLRSYTKGEMVAAIT